MEHVMHISRNKQILEIRSQILRSIREFFWLENFLEVETPCILRTSGQEPNLQAMKVLVHNEHHEPFTGYLHTSPEYTMKKMLAAGFDNIFTICKAFRSHESFGGIHNPEFTIIEWYRAHHDFFTLMDDMEHLFQFMSSQLEQHTIGVPEYVKKKWKRTRMRDVWKTHVHVNLDEYLDQKFMYRLCIEKGFKPKADESYEELFYRIFLNVIEPHLGIDCPEILYYYPSPMASLSKRSEKEQGYAERFEVYAGGMELANGFTELNDASEQRMRLEEDKKERARLGLDAYEIDNEFVEAVGMMPPCTGNSMGIDRIVQVFTGCKNIDDVLILPASKIFPS